MANGIITGKGAMDRLGITALQLQDVLRDGELVAVQDDLITRRTPESDPCLFCDGRQELETGVSYPTNLQGAVVLCEHAPERDVHQLSHRMPPEVYLERMTDFPDAPDMVAKPRCVHRWTEEQRTLRIEAAKFLLFELEAYEKANGIEPGSKPDTTKEIVDSAEALKQALCAKVGDSMGEAELAELIRQMENFKRFASMPAKEAAARMEVRMMAHLAPHLLDPPGTPMRREGYVNGLQTPGGGREAAPLPVREELPKVPRVADSDIGTVQFAQELLAHYPTKAEAKTRISKLMERFPRLTASECGSLAKYGIGTSDNSSDADAKWYHRNKPR